MTNQEIIRKADLALSDLISDGGYLNPEQTNAFIRKLIAQPTLLAQSRVVTMGAPTRQINKIGFGSRILRPAVSATALSTNDRAKPTTEQILLTTTEVIAQVNLSYDVIEDNIERGDIAAAGGSSVAPPVVGSFKDTVLTLMAERVALDLEELAIKGDTGSGDPYLALLDGYILQATANVVNVASAPISRAMFKSGLQTMPDAYKRSLASMKHFVSMNQEIEYRDAIGVRETTAGDAANESMRPVYGMGVQVEGVSLMPAATGLLTNPLNLIFGIQRKISMEVDKDIEARVFKIVVTARVDFKIEEPEAVVKYTNIAVV